MPDTIRDGAGSGYLVTVNKKNRLLTTAETESIQHTVSLYDEEAYQCIGLATLANGTVTSLHIKNISINKDMVFTYARHQIINPSGGTSFPNISNYFSISL